MPEKTPLPEICVSSQTGVGEVCFWSDWQKGKHLKTALESDFLDIDTPLCRFFHSGCPWETLGWLYPDACVLSPAAESHKAPVETPPITSFLAAATYLFREAEAVTAAVETARLERYAARLTHRERGAVGNGVFRCFFSRFFPTFWVDYDLLTALCPRIYVIEDTPLPTGHRLMHALYRRLCQSGQTLIAGMCPISGTAEQLLLPETGVGFVLANRWHPVDFPVYQRVPMARFYPGLNQRSDRYERGTDELMKEVVRCIP